MVAACADPVAVGVTEDGDGAGAQAATSMSKHRLNQRTCRQAAEEICIGVLLWCLLGRCCSPRALPMRCRVICTLSFLDACFRFAHDAFRRLAPPLVGTKHLLWHDGGGIRQAPISEATGDLRNLPGPILHMQRKLKVPLIVVRIPVGSNGLEQQKPG